MIIFPGAKCDGPGCDVIEQAVGRVRYPDGWITIDLLTGAADLDQPTGMYGFHSRECFIAWAKGRKP